MNTRLYRKIYERQAAFYQTHRWAKVALLLLNYALTASVLALYVSLLAFRAVETDWFGLWLCMLFPVGCFCAVFVVRQVFPRKRPYDINGAGIQPVFKKLHASDKSFPSRHIAMTFAIGGVWLAYSLRIGILTYVAGILLGYIRFSAGLHYPTDLLGGALMGGGFGVLIFAF